MAILILQHQEQRFVVEQQVEVEVLAGQVVVQEQTLIITDLQEQEIKTWDG